jgi:hypothetical protein
MNFSLSTTTTNPILSLELPADNASTSAALNIFDGTIIHPALQTASVYVTDGEEFTNYAILNRTRSRFYQQHRPHDFGQVICHLRADGHLAAAKAEFPIYDHLKGKARKYLVETGKTPIPTLTPIPETIHHLIEQVNGVEIPATYYPATIAQMPPGGEILRGWGDGTRLTSEVLPSATPGDVWHGIDQAKHAAIGMAKACKSISLFIVEGDKEAKALLSLGYLAISLPGHHMAFLGGELHKSLQKLAPHVNIYLALDKDANPETAALVRKSEWKIATALKKIGAQVKHLQWDNEQGKGIGDVLTNIYLADGYETAVNWLQNAMGLAPTHFRWLDWVRKQTHRQAHHHPIAPTRITKGAYLPSYQPQPGLTIIDAPLGAGKTTAMIMGAALAIHQPQMYLLWWCPTNALGGQVANRIEQQLGVRIPHTQDYRRDSRADLEALHMDIAHHQGVVSCGQAYFHNPSQFMTEPLALTMDEPGEFLKGLFMSKTYGNPQRQQAAILAIAQTLKHAAQTGGVTVAQKGVTSHVTKALMALCGTEDSNTRLLIHHKDSVKPQIKICTRETQVRAAVFEKIGAGERVAVYSTSKLNARCLKREILSRYPDKKVVLFRAESSNVGEFIANPDIYIESNQIDVLIYTPVATSGLSIDIQGYFSAAVGFCGTLTAADHEQGLGRVREPIPRIVYCPERIMAIRPKGFSIKGIMNAQVDSALKTSRWYQLPNFNAPSDPQWAQLQGIIDEFIAAQEQLDHAYAEMGYRGLQLLYEEAGYEVEICEDAPEEAKELKAERQTTRDGIWRDDAQFEASLSVDPHRHTETWAAKTLASTAASLADRVRAAKVMHLLSFPGVEFDAEKFYKLFYLDYGKAAGRLELRAAVKNLAVIAELEGLENAEIMSQEIKFYRRLGKRFLQALVVASLELMDFHTERIVYHRSHPLVQALDRKYKQGWVRELIFEAFGWTIHEGSNAIDFLHDVFNRLGIGKKLQGRRTVADGVRELFYRSIEDDLLTTECLEASAHRLLERLSVKNKMCKLSITGFTDMDWSRQKILDPAELDGKEIGRLEGDRSDEVVLI